MSRVMTEQQKEAARVRARIYYYANREEILKQSKAWRQANPDKCKTYYARYRKNNPAKYAAQYTVWNAKVAGRVTEPDRCETCGIEAALDAHHDDYTKPLEVRWLCRDCHAAHHRQFNEIGRKAG